MKKKVIKKAFKDTLPVLAGYLFLGFGFGILLQNAGFGVLWAVAMCLTLYSGTMQYIAVGLFAAGTDIFTAAVTTLLVNARHLFYGISMVDRYKGAGKRKPYMIFTLTDETFSLVSRKEVGEMEKSQDYCFWVSFLDHMYWVVGSFIGNLAGSLLPINFDGIEFVITALFATIFIEQWQSSNTHIYAIIGLCSTALCLFIFGGDLFLIPSMVIITALLLIMRRKAQ